jgi:hypothetical protein
MGYGSTFPHLAERLDHKVAHRGSKVRARGVALQVAFERQILKPGFSLDRF